MMKRKPIKPEAVLRMMTVIPLSLFLIIAIVSCSGSRKAAKTSKESPPPPPPPPPPPVSMNRSLDEVFVVVEQMPVYPGGDEALIRFVSSNIRYPEEAKVKNITGQVAVRFIITADGQVDQVTVIRGVDPLLDNEAVRVTKLLSGWKPGMQGGKPVNVWHILPVTFALSGDGKIPRVRYSVYGNDTIYYSAQEPPQFPGGKDALAKFKSDNLKIPVDLVNAGFTGNVNISFIIATDGRLSKISVSAGVSPSLDAEALRVVKMMPPWTPGKENGRPVTCRQSVYFNFYPEAKGGEAPQEVFVVVQEMPQFPGGDTALMSFIFKNIQYPKEAKEKGIQGRVVVRFCINYLGGTEQVGVIRGVDPLLDAEAIRVVKLLPEWKPGKQGGKPVNVWYSIPVTFALKGDDITTGKPPVAAAPSPAPVRPAVPPLVTGYDEPPIFQGGEKAILKFIAANMKYPQEAKDKKISGTVMIRLFITETGKAERATVMSSVDPLLDAEALRIVSLLPQWQPAKLQGKPVAVSYTIPVTFK